jgi:16S rRNA processing protein RimM
MLADEPRRGEMAELVEVVVGVIGRAHGVRGEVAVDLRTDEPDRRLAPGQRLRAEDTSRVFTVASRRDHAGRLLVTFVELDDRAAADAVRGTRLVADVPAGERPVGAGEFYDRQLVGMRVRTAAGAEVGQVVTVLHLPQQDVLEIETPVGARLVPFVEALVPVVDLEHGSLTVVALEGLLADGDNPA